MDEMKFGKLLDFEINISNNKKRDLFHLPMAKSKDLLIRFPESSSRSNFIDYLLKMATDNGQNFNIFEKPDHEIIENAMTAKKRKVAIEEFIKCAFEQTVHSGDVPDFKQLEKCEHGDLFLSKMELASLFGQRTESILMKRIFETIDKDKGAHDFGIIELFMNFRFSQSCSQ